MSEGNISLSSTTPSRGNLDGLEQEEPDTTNNIQGSSFQSDQEGLGGGDIVAGDSDDEESGEGGDDNELVVMDPNHPLMKRVQAAFKAQLTRQNEKLEIELQEKTKTVKILQTERENIGVDLYGVQQHLARQQMLLEQEQDTFMSLTQLREQKEKTLADVRKLYKNMQEQIKDERQQTLQLRHNVENTAARLRYLDEAKNTVKNDIALTKRATEKTTTDVSKAQKDKLKQDLYLDHLTTELHNLDEQLALTEAQCAAQAQETKDIKEILTDASMELETILLEKKRLFNQWNSALIGMRRRDDAYALMVTAVHAQQEQRSSLEMEIDNYKKSINKEQEKNEDLTMMLNKLDADIEHTKKKIESSTIKREALKMEYMTYTRTLQETEQSLARANTDCTLKQSELAAIRTQTEREILEKHKLEDAIMEKMMQRLTMDKASQYTQRSVKKSVKRSKELDIMVANAENEISLTRLQASQVTSQLQRLQQTLDEHNTAAKEKNDLISDAEAEILKNNSLVERKQMQIDQLAKKIYHKMSELDGGEDFGPLEQKIDELQKKIAQSVDRCSQMQQFWLRQQNDLVKKTRNSSEQAESVDSLKKRLLILDQKKIRIDALQVQEERDKARVEHNISSLQKDMVRLNTLISKKRGEQDRLVHGAILAEKDFVNALKESELESIQMQSQIDQLHEEKERLLNSLMESERQIMLWEKKIQIAREMKDSVDSESGRAEVNAMKAEIHRMQVRYDQLMRRQENMIQDMERAVYRREAITLKGELQSKTGQKDQTQGHLKKKITDMQRQIKQTMQEAYRCEKLFNDLQSTQTTLAAELEEKQADFQEMRATLEGLHLEVTYAEEKKKENMTALLSSQAKVKYMNAAKDGKYKLLVKTKEGREKERQRQQEKLQALQAITERLEIDYPEYRSQLRNLSVSLKSRLMGPADNINLKEK